MYDLPLDFSAISRLSCARAYQLSCVQGLSSDSAATKFGKAVHKFMEYRALGDKTSVVELGQRIGAELSLPAGDIGKLVAVGLKLDVSYKFPPTPLTDTLGNPLVEYKFSIPYRQLDEFNIILCGTIDLLTYRDNVLHFPDYKTTAGTGAAADRIMSEYNTSFQLPFYLYIIHKYLHKFLPPELQDAAINLRMAGSYVFIKHSYTPAQLDTSPTIYLSATDIIYIEELIDYCIPKMIALHKRKTLAPPEGSVYKLCAKCNFLPICSIHDHDRMLAVIEQSPKRHYDPTNF